MSDKTIVVTRPRGDEKILTDALHAVGLRVIHEPLMEIFLRHTERQALNQLLINEPDAVIVTSRHAVQAMAILSDLRDSYLLCVGDATEQEAQSQGFTRTATGGGNVEALLEHIAAGYDEGSRFLYASGSHVRMPLETVLGEKGMQVDRLTLYDALASEQLSDTLVEQFKRQQIDAITFMSQRTAHIFAALLEKAEVQDASHHLHAFCLSDAVAEPLESLPWKGIHTAREATLASLVECIDNTFAT